MKIIKITITFIIIFLFKTQCIAKNENYSLIIKPDIQYQYAEQCYNNKDYNTSILEYKRFIHFFPKDKRIRYAEFKIGKAYFYLKEYLKAIDIFKKFSLFLINDTLSIESYFMLTRAYLNINKIGLAETSMQNLLILTNDNNVKDRIYSFLAWIYLKKAEFIETHALNKADSYITKISKINEKKFYKNEIKKDIISIKKQDEKSPTIAGFSSIIPGAGFLYCERYRDAFVSFLLNTALILAAHKSFQNGNNALGGIISFVEMGFYSGNIYGGISSAKKYNKFQKQQIIENMEKKYTPFSQLHTNYKNNKKELILLSFNIPF